MKTAEPYLFVAAVIAVVYAEAIWLRWRKHRNERPIPLTHPSARHFTQGLVPTHGAAPVTPREQAEFDRITSQLTGPAGTERNSKP